MFLSPESKGNSEYQENKSFFDYCRECRGNLKNWIKEQYKCIKNALIDLNLLKEDIQQNEVHQGEDGESDQLESDISYQTSSQEIHHQNIHSHIGESQQYSNTSISQESLEIHSQNLSEKMLEIIVCGESGGKYGAVNKNDNGSVSLGLIQWHGKKAVDLLNRLKNTDAKTFNSIMTDPIFSNIEKAGWSVWNESQANQFKTLMQNPKYQETMKNMGLESMDYYINYVKNRGVTDPRAILAWGRICNAGIGFARNRIKNVMEREGASINDYKQVIAYYRKTSHGQRYDPFKKKYKQYGNKTLEEVIGEYKG